MVITINGHLAQNTCIAFIQSFYSWSAFWICTCKLHHVTFANKGHLSTMANILCPAAGLFLQDWLYMYMGLFQLT